MRRLAEALALLVMVAVVGLVGLVHHVSGARFQATADMEPMTTSECVALLTTPPHVFPSDAATTICHAGAGAAWFRVTVTNSGRRGAYLKGCHLAGLDGSGQVVFQGFVSTGDVDYLTGPHLGGGHSFTYSWYLTSSPESNDALPSQSGALRYQVSCRAIDYHGTPPV